MRTVTVPSQLETILNSLIQYITSPYILTEQEIYHEVLEEAVALSNSKIGYLHLYNEETQEIELNVWSHRVIEQCRTVYDGHYPLHSAGIWAECIRQRQAVIHNDYSQEASKRGLPEGHFPITRHLGLPICEGDRIVGVLGVGNRETPYHEKDVILLQEFIQGIWSELIKQIANLGLHRQEMGDRFQQTTPQTVLIQMIEAISNALEIRDQYTAQHQASVATIAENIAKNMGLSESICLGIRIGALVHDIGKIGIPAEILTRPGNLKKEEFELIKTHPIIGAEIFKDTILPWPIREIILQHHERLDGSGYPFQIHQNSIILEARIIAVADVFEAMSSHRPYRPSLGQEYALKHIIDGRGKIYDPYVVDALLSYLNCP
ncbi:MAG: HD domain-containing protein [Oscillatoriales cyanobacterium]|jgi:putative nucleotidyltransferase with HDIG domain|nr:MAG: HD domain-containing protein [Oscillatoriales cyanobacterium]